MTEETPNNDPVKAVARAMPMTMMLSAPPVENNDPAKAALILIDVGTILVRSHADYAIRQYMSNNEKTEQKLSVPVQRFFAKKRKEIEKNKQLLPIYNKIEKNLPDDLNNFDLTSCLMIFEYLLDGGSKGWTSYPSSSDQSVVANLQRLKLMRNEIFLKINNFQMPMPSMNDDEDDDDEEDPVEQPLGTRLERILIGLGDLIGSAIVKGKLDFASSKVLSQYDTDALKEEILRLMVNDKAALELTLKKAIETFDWSMALTDEFRDEIEDFIKSRASIEENEIVYSNLKDILEKRSELIQIALKFGQDLKKSEQSAANFTSSILKIKLICHIDRRDLFVELDNLLNHQNNIIIQGPAGSGKTNLLHDFGQYHKEMGYLSNCIVRWFNGMTRQSIWNDYREISFELGLDYAIPKYILNNRIGKKLAKNSKTILFLFDNVTNMDDLKEFRRYMPSNVKFIITTDGFEDFTEFEYAVYNMKPLTFEQCARYIETSKKLKKDEMKQLMEHISWKGPSESETPSDGVYYPYRLEKTAALFRLNSTWTLNDYLKFTKQLESTTNIESASEIETFALLNILKNHYPKAFEILNHCFYLNTDMISKDVLVDSLKETLTQEDIDNHLEFLVNLALLNTIVTLVSKCIYEGYIMHPIVKYVFDRRFLAPDRLENKGQMEQQNIIISLTNVLSSKMPFIDKDDDHDQDEEWKKAKMYYQSAANVVKEEIDLDKNEREATPDTDTEAANPKSAKRKKPKKEMDKKKRFTLFEKVINYNKIVFSDYVKSIDILSDDLKLKERFYRNQNQTSEHPEVVMAYNNLGLAYAKLNKNREAFKYILKGLEMADYLTHKGSADNKRFYALTQNNLASVIKLTEKVDTKEPKNKRIDLALEYQEHAMKYREAVNKGFGHEDIATSYNNIAMTFQKMGKYQEALEYLEKAIKMNINLFRSNNLKLALSISNLANLQLHLGYYKSAIANLEKVARMYRKIYEADSVEEALTFNNIGSALLKIKRPDDALKYLEDSLKIYNRLNKKDNLIRATLLNNCGRLYSERREIDRAIQCLREASKIKMRIIKENWNQDFISSIGDIYFKLGEICSASKDKSYRLWALTYWDNSIVLYSLIEQDDMVKIIRKRMKKMDSNWRLKVCLREWYSSLRERKTTNQIASS